MGPEIAQALRDGTQDFTLVDTRSTAAYDAGHLPGAVCTARDALPDGPLVVYCWGPRR
ncbi:MAG TPA: rhodanese-like domain-containing protein [Solirubrobacter sp.]|nr:rhodanese-like domain-containing protein [Solirubrobacter sp.]